MDRQHEATERGTRPATASARNALLVLIVCISSLGSVLTFVGVSSTAAFTTTTGNSGSSFTAGTVVLGDDDTGSAMFSVSGMAPGDSTSRCIEVTYSGTIVDPGVVKVYNGGFTDSGTLATYLDLTIERGTGGSFSSCTGFSSETTIESGTTLSGFASTHTNYSNGAGTWDPSSTPVSKTYRITVALDAAAPNGQQGASVTSLAFTWEIQS